MMPAALTVVPTQSRALSLYDTEQALMCFADTAELVPVEQEAEFLVEFRAGLIAAAQKRDDVAHFLTHLDTQSALAAAEIKRLQERKAFFERATERLKGYVIQVIESLGADAKGKPRRLEGITTTMSIRNCPASVEITNESAVPAEYKSVTITLPLSEWEALLDSLDVDAGARVLGVVKQGAIAVSKTAIKAALEAGPVEGAMLVTDKKSLVRK